MENNDTILDADSVQAMISQQIALELGQQHIERISARVQGEAAMRRAEVLAAQLSQKAKDLNALKDELAEMEAARPADPEA